MSCDLRTVSRLLPDVRADLLGMLADWFAAWTVLIDYLGPESVIFNLMEGDSQDGT